MKPAGTGDENIVEAQIVVQYRVADPSKFLFRLREPEVALGAATEVALHSTVGSMTIDQVMIEERTKVQGISAGWVTLPDTSRWADATGESR